jgi:hypothetical protein
MIYIYICGQHTDSSEIWTVSGVREYIHWQAFFCDCSFHVQVAFGMDFELKNWDGYYSSPLIRGQIRTPTQPFGKCNVGSLRRRGFESKSRWMTSMRWTWGQDCCGIHILVTCRQMVDDSLSGRHPLLVAPRGCAVVDWDWWVFRPQLEFITKKWKFTG